MNPRANSSLMQTGEEGYIEFKGWQLAGFAKITTAEREYFSREMKAYPQLSVRRALEIGFGLGAFLRFGKDRGWAMSGTEAIPALVEAARAAGLVVPRHVV